MFRRNEDFIKITCLLLVCVYVKGEYLMKTTLMRKFGQC